MKHLQKYIEKNPMKKKRRRITVKTTVIGGDVYGIVGGGAFVGFVDISRKPAWLFTWPELIYSGLF